MAPHWFHRELHGGERGHDVEVVARKLLVAGNDYDADVIIHVRGYQQAHDLPVTGIVDEATAASLGEAADWDLPPEWFTRDIELGMSGKDVERVQFRIGCQVTGVYDACTERAVRRLQSHYRQRPTGVVDLDLALLIP